MKRTLAYVCVLLSLSLAVFSGCGGNPPGRKPATVTDSSWSILADTIYETEVFQFETDREGPRVCIVGGIHGDELAGWNAA